MTGKKKIPKHQQNVETDPVTDLHQLENVRMLLMSAEEGQPTGRRGVTVSFPDQAIIPLSPSSSLRMTQTLKGDSAPTAEPQTEPSLQAESCLSQQDNMKPSQLTVQPRPASDSEHPCLSASPVEHRGSRMWMCWWWW